MATARMRSRKPTDSSRWWRKSWNCFSRVVEGEGGAWASPSAIEGQQRVAESGGGRRLWIEVREVGKVLRRRGERRVRGGWGLGLGFMEREREKQAFRNADFMFVFPVWGF